MDLQGNVTAGTGAASLTPGAVLRTVLTARYSAVFLYRLSQRTGRWLPFLAGLIKQFNQFLTGADLAWQSSAGSGLVLFHPSGVVIGPDVRLGRDCKIQQGVTLGGLGSSHGAPPASPTIGNRVAVGAGARVIGKIELADDCEVGANAVVTKSGPAGWVAVGIPATWRARSEHRQPQ
ncbi:serine O-acetyltransferase [Microterricola pindariensis]|uniref:serine O-acetyltransferase n=1 Tax=Microterricola pindariensis TaxID=478010 RepID=UPI001374A20B|nr:serine O-acetyltransferase [Microterricola pindariensis]